MHGTTFTIGFNPRPPRGGRPGIPNTFPALGWFQSAPPSRGATGIRTAAANRLQVSIRAPLAGGDRRSERPGMCREVSIRAPLAGGDPDPCVWDALIKRFNPRPPRGGRPGDARGVLPAGSVSIRAPLAGGDGKARYTLIPESVSIRAPLAGGDLCGERGRGHRWSFNPRPPRGGRPFGTRSSLVDGLFQSAPPSRGATPGEMHMDGCDVVSIRAPLAGGDPSPLIHNPHVRSFNPRPPRGGRLMVPCGEYPQRWFQSAPPSRGATSDTMSLASSTRFQSAPPSRGATETNKWGDVG